MTATQNAMPNLEESLKEISQLIENMEHSELSLEDSLKNFERGITLVKHCQKILEEAEQKVQILIQNNNKEELAAYRVENQEKNDPENDENDE